MTITKRSHLSWDMGRLDIENTLAVKGDGELLVISIEEGDRETRYVLEADDVEALRDQLNLWLSSNA